MTITIIIGAVAATHFLNWVILDLYFIIITTLKILILIMLFK